jgi:hypothetical protein
MSKTIPVAIGNGLYAQARKRETLMEWYRRLQSTCPHTSRDPRGTCYKCGKAGAK